MLDSADHQFPFGLNKARLVAEIRELAADIESGAVLAQSVTRKLHESHEDFDIRTLSVSFAAPYPEPKEEE